MRPWIAFVLLPPAVLLSGCNDPDPPRTEETGTYAAAELSPKLKAAANIVDAVNAKDADQYARDLADDVTVSMYGREPILTGKQAVQANRENHFCKASRCPQ